MAFAVYLDGGPEPVAVGRSQNPRLTTVDEPTEQIVVPVEGGRQGVFRYTEETIAVGASSATVFAFTEIR